MTNVKLYIDKRSLAKFEANMKRLGKDALKQLARNLYTEGEELLAEAIPLTPLEFSPLRNSGRVELPRISGNRVSVTVGFGGPAAPYALYVHEMPSTNNFTTPGTGPKYLERPARRRARGLAGRINRDLIRTATARGL